jgi:hypothetical protein
MPKKHQKEDLRFIKNFARQLKTHYEKAKKQGLTDEVFADSLDVSRQALQDYLDGKAMPTIRALALAVHHYKIEVGYEGTDFKAACPQQLVLPSDEQLSFPFLLVSPDPRLALRIGPATENTVTLGLYIKRTG